ncbi:MAG: peptidoglycan editing factor PgeF [bacterium]
MVTAKVKFVQIEDLTLETYLHFDQLGLSRAYTTTKKNGVSQGAYQGLNLSLEVGDKKEDVLKNRSILAQRLKTNLEKIVTCKQVHKTKVATVKSNSTFKCFENYQADALITNLTNVPIAILTADCLPIFILDPINKAIGLAHAGWRGTLENISEKILETMKKEYHTEAASCLISIGPSIKTCCCQVSLELAEKFLSNFHYLKSRFITLKDQTYYLNLTLINKELLINLGVKKDNILISKNCTFCQREYFFSYRRDKKDTGRMMSLMFLL